MAAGIVIAFNKQWAKHSKTQCLNLANNTSEDMNHTSANNKAMVYQNAENVESGNISLMGTNYIARHNWHKERRMRSREYVKRRN